MRYRRDERGVSALIFALLLTALLTMSAFAVDLGAAFTERRHDQNTADAAVMSAVVESVIGGGVVNDVVAEVKDKVDTTLGKTVTDAEWTACQDPDHLHYTTVDLQAGNPTINPVTQCISFNITFDRVRVRLPDQKVTTVFAESLGLSELKTSASAEAQVVNGAGSGAPPFVALSTATQGDFVCLRTSSNPQPQTLLRGLGPNVAPDPLGVPTDISLGRRDPCDKGAYDVSSSNFGTISPFRYTAGCTRQNSDVEVAISLGIDHIMGFFAAPGFTGTLGVINDGDRVDGAANCTTAFPNTFRIDTGFNAQGLRCALLSLSGSATCNGETPRFRQGPYEQSTFQFAGEDMDNATIWQFLRPAAELYDANVPAECVVLAAIRPDNIDDFDETATWNTWPYIQSFPMPVEWTPTYDADGDLDDYLSSAWTTFDLRLYDDPPNSSASELATDDWDHHDRYDLLTECLENWDPIAGDELFEVEIGLSPRFAFIPRVAEPDLDGISYVHIESFLPTFMYRLYQDTSAGAAPCDPRDPRPLVQFAVHDAGQRFSCGASNQNVDRLSSIMLACGMVPDELCNKDTGAPDFGGQDIYEFRLVE